MAIASDRRERVAWRSIAGLVSLVATVSGCGGEPSAREIGNARAFEALLTAVSLKNPTELEADARRIDDRHQAGELSDANYAEILKIIEKGRARDWASAEERAYAFRRRFGDRGAYFR